MEHIIIVFKIDSKSISSSWVTQVLWPLINRRRGVIVDQSITEHQTDLLNLYSERTSWKQALFLKPVTCHLPCNGYAPFSVSIEQLWKHCGNDAVVRMNSMLLSNLSQNALCSLFTHTGYGLLPIKKKTTLFFY